VKFAAPCCASLFWLLILAAPLSPAETNGPLPQTRVLEGHRLYYAGELRKAADAYAKALKEDPSNLEAWLNGAIVHAELGERARSAEWLHRALSLAPQDGAVRTALAEAELRRNNPQEALDAVAGWPQAVPKDDPFAFIVQGRSQLALGFPKDAVQSLSQAAALAPLLSLAHFWLGQAQEAAGDSAGAVEAYRKAVQKDSYFSHARYQLVRSYLRTHRFYEAWKQAIHLLDADPRNSRFRVALAGITRKSVEETRPEVEERSAGSAPAAPEDERRESAGTPLPPEGKIPMLRVGLGTDSMGRIPPRRDVYFRCTSAFAILEAKNGRRLTTGAKNALWRVRQPRGAGRIEFYDENGKRRLVSKTPQLIKPENGSGLVVLKDVPADYGSASRGGGERPLRGSVEAAVGRKGLRLVNVVDLEGYTHGVLASEMPIKSPMEALKAQAVVARSHALYIQTVTRRHVKAGYDICDGQHCQVYWGVRNETARSRAVVEATRGRVAAYQGRIAHVLYASNCGGHSQSGCELQGWGDVPYWKGILDAPESVRRPISPWELRRWLRETPQAYCRGSDYVHPAHFRWTRYIPASDLEERINRSIKIGKLLGLQTLKRARSGHLNSVKVLGSRDSRVVTKEFSLRGLLGDGSQRSALFVVDTDVDKNGRPKAFTFYGGGWGHGVGMCQSGAMGRAQAGQSYADILAAYYPGIELGNLRY
jgi:SpoIID/LytB domain protein